MKPRASVARGATFLVLSVACLVFVVIPIQSQPNDEAWRWTPPLAVSNGIDGISYTVWATADDKGIVHAVWIQDTDLDEVFDSVFYAYWDETGWSEPVDIVYQQEGIGLGSLEFVDGMLYMLGVDYGLRSVVVYRASTMDAGSAWGWRSSIVAEGNGGSLFVDTVSGMVVVVVTTRQELQMYSAPNQDALVWTPPDTIMSMDNMHSISQAHLIGSALDGMYYLTWTEFSADLNWNPSGIGFLRSADRGQTWADELSLSNRESFPRLYVAADGHLEWYWNRGVGEEDGRYRRLSFFQGGVWDEPVTVLHGLSGRSGWPMSVWDSAGQLHHISSGFGFGRQGGIYYASDIEGGQLSDPQLISDPLTFSEGPSLALRLGNELHVLWYDQGVIYHSHMRVPVAGTEPRAVEQRSTGVGASSELFSTSVPSESQPDQFMVENTFSFGALATTFERRSLLRFRLDPSVAIILSGALSLMLVLSALAFRRQKR